MLALETVVAALLNQIGTADAEFFGELALVPVGANEALVNDFGFDALD